MSDMYVCGLRTLLAIQPPNLIRLNLIIQKNIRALIERQQQQHQPNITQHKYKRRKVSKLHD